MTVRSRFAVGTLAPGEQDIITGPLTTWLGKESRAVIFCHGAGDRAADPFRDQSGLVWKTARHATVHVGDLGLDTWGNDVAMSRITAAITALSSRGQSGRVALVGMSMGACNALNYAYRYPEQVACVAGVIPLVDLAAAYAMPGFSEAINAAYPPSGYSPSTHPNRDPVGFAAALPSDMPIRLWAAADDPFVPYSTAQAFVAARPQTVLTNLGNVGHTDTAVSVATPSMVQFIRDTLK